MLLAVDVGNTQTKLGVFRQEKLIHEWRASTDARRTADELALMFGEFLSVAELSFSHEITGVAISSVVPSATQQLREMTLRYFGFPPVVVEPGVRTGIAVATDNPREVGADRIANAVAARDMFPDCSAVIVDLGTAIKVDVVSARGEFLGGAIAPGMDTSAAALFQSAAQLRRVELVAPPHVIGRSTVTSIQSGVVYGAAALVDGLLERVLDELGEDAGVVATGGLGPTVVRHCRAVERLEPALTLLGLRLVYERNTTREEE
jgi:type III pantothenate kinase